MGSIFASMEISATALAAERLRMNLIAENLANAEVTHTPSGGPYRRKGVVLGAREASAFEGLLNAGATPGGVEVLKIVESQTLPNQVYNPSHPDADAKGYVAMPNINPVMEMVDLVSASRAYEANVSAIQIAKNMVTKTLEIGR
ncbi:flagellar basal body rod protein FlgC [Candidatus Methylomirabilis sp.]|uniref:flagellar basal body rod protein FlgC n=1 Tax=Candidatus Methylomirabilis sp. TaxID=2032687 RepID=UPI002A5E729D|nr:flagellar basal body rod protein FlgC [Candidatus Methylomirabilis sp.]